jgi:hypothetical protein
MSDEVVEATLTSAEPELRRATKLSSRSGRSERECGSTASGRDITEFLPRAQAFADAQTRETLRLLDLDERLQALRNATTAKPRKKMGRRKQLVFKVVHRFPGADGRMVARLLDDIKAPGLPSMKGRKWAVCWDSRDRKLQHSVQRWVYEVRAAAKADLSPVTGR